jgi:deoxyxylulose-5-phosphate synthase
MRKERRQRRERRLAEENNNIVVVASAIRMQSGLGIHSGQWIDRVIGEGSLHEQNGFQSGGGLSCSANEWE